MCRKNDYNFIDKWSKKIRAINYLGGKCKKCGNDNIFHLSFHHLYGKESDIFNNLISYKWSQILIELDKCELLCHNCHNEIHTNNNTISEYRESKKLFLEYKGSKCIKCGYNKNNAGLVFHHRSPSEKEFLVSEFTLRKLNEKIKNELDKCDVLCHNCHIELHTDIEKFNILKNKIYYKVENFRELNTSSGNRAKKKNRTNNTFYSNLKLEYKNMSQRKLAEKYNVNRSTIRRWLKSI